MTFLQGARVGNRTRIGVGAIVHLDTKLARKSVAAADFFEHAFGLESALPGLHERVVNKLLDEVYGWTDVQIDGPK